MISASAILNPVNPAPATVGADPATAGVPGFDLAMAAVQADTRNTPVLASANAEGSDAAAALAMMSGLLVRAVVPGESAHGAELPAHDVEADADVDAMDESAEAGAAAILAQMLAGSTPPAPAVEPQVPEPAAQGISLQSAAPPVSAKPVRSNVATVAADADADEEIHATGDAGEPAAAGFDAARVKIDVADAMTQATAFLVEKPPEMPAQGGQGAASGGAQAVVQAAAAMRDAVAVPAASAPIHATLREPVGTARWADELGNRLVMMSVRGQQQGSLTLTPEHLGPVEVQISMNRDTAHVWFGAQHADTRAALTEAMPRLRELLASSGLSLGQSGVSEQAPRDGFTPSRPDAGVNPVALDADPGVELSVPAWRLWRPGILDTYA